MRRLVLALGLLLTTAGLAPAQAPTATMTGRVREANGTPIADATLRLVSSARSRETRTDASGHFVLVGLAAGTYDLRVAAPGRRSASLAAIVLGPGLRARLDVALAPGDPAETTALDPAVMVRLDGSSSATLADPLLTHLPLERRQALTAVPDYLPGLARGSAFGAAAGTSTVRRVDGIDLTDPMDGSAWTSYIATSAGEVSVRAAGAGVGEGGFANALVDVVTVPGSHRLSGMIDALVTTGGMTGTNLSDEQLAEDPHLAGRDALTRSVDASGLVGGPLHRDRAQFLAAFGFARDERDPAGPRTRLEETTPRLQGRVSFTPGTASSGPARAGAAQTLAASVLFDRPSLDGVAGPAVSGVVDDSVADRLSGRTVGARVLWQRPMTPRLALEASYGLLAGSRQLEPAAPAPGRLDAITGGFSDSQGLVHDASRQRHHLAAHVTRDLPAAGFHLLQAGMEAELGRISETTAFVDDEFFVDFAGRPALVLEWAGDRREGRSRRLSVFVNDTWTPARRITLDAGVRADVLRGSTPNRGAVYRTTTVQPRGGVAADFFGNGRTVARAHGGVYADPLYFSHYDRATPGASPLITLELRPGGARRELERTSPLVYAVEDGLRHPRTLETSFGVDQRLTRGARVGVTAVFRELRHVVDARFADARWVALSRPGLNNVPITVYRWVNRLASQASGTIGNVDGVTYEATNGTALGTAEASRTSRAVVVDGRLDDPRARWAVLGAVTLSRVRGTLDNTFESGIGRGSQFESPSAALVNADGRASQTPEREYTVLATVRLPRVDARVSAAYIGQDGLYYAAVRQFGSETLDFPVSEAGRRVLLEARGSRALEMDHRLDLRAEYGLGIGGGRRATLYVDVMNVLNRATVLRVEERYPFAPAGAAGIVLFDAPVEVRSPRRIYIGGRVRF